MTSPRLHGALLLLVLALSAAPALAGQHHTTPGRVPRMPGIPDPASPGLHDGLSDAIASLCKVGTQYHFNLAVKERDAIAQRFPEGTPFWLEVKANHANNPAGGYYCPTNDSNLGDAPCIVGLTFGPPGSGAVPPTAPDESAQCRTTHYLRGVGQGPKLAESGARLTIATDRPALGLCQVADVSATVVAIVGGREFPFDPAKAKVAWTKPDGLTDAPCPPAISAPGGGAVFRRCFRALAAGAYRIEAALESVPSLRELETDLMTQAWARAQRGESTAIFESQLTRVREQLQAARSAVDVTVTGTPTVKHLGLLPAGAQLLPGESMTFAAQAAFAESCIPPRDVTGEAAWSSTIPGSGGNTVTAPPAEPDALTVTPAGPAGEVKACQSIPFKAVMSYRRAAHTITARFGLEASAPITIRAPAPRDVTSDGGLAWTPAGPSVVPQEGGALTVTATYPGATTGSATIQVKPPTPGAALVVRPPRATLQVGQSVGFAAFQTFEETCVRHENVTARVTWTPGPGATFRADQPYDKPVRIQAKLADAAGERAGEASVRVLQPSLVIEPPNPRIELDQPPMLLTAKLETPYWSAPPKTATWSQGPEISGEICGAFPVTVTAEGGQSATTIVTVEAPASYCVELRKQLAVARDKAADRSHVQESQRWLEERVKLFQNKGCDCGDVGLPPAVEANLCQDPDRMPKTGNDGLPAGCGECREGLVEDRGAKCVPVTEILASANCPDKRMAKEYLREQKDVFCRCPPDAPQYNQNQGVCFAAAATVDPAQILPPLIQGLTRPRPRTMPPPTGVAPAPAPPSGQRCHRNPQTGRMHCGSN